MPEMNRFDEQLREAFAGFEPEVVPNFEALEAELAKRADGGKSELSRRYRMARRVATVSSALTLGLLGWLVLRDDEAIETRDEGAPSEWVKFDGQGSNGMRAGVSADAGSAAARTSNAVVISEAQEVPSAPGQVVDSPDAQEVRGRSGAEDDPGATRVNALGVASAEAGAAAAIADERAIGIASSVQEACEGTEVMFKLDGDWTEGSFLWNFGDGSFSSESEPSHVFNRPGTYDITISVRSHNDGQIRTRTVENMIVVRPRPEAVLNWKLPKSVDGKRVSVQLENQTERTSSSTWLIGEEKLAQSRAELKVPGEYPVHLVASNAYGCQDHSMAMLRLGDRLAAGAPSSFSPDGDGRYDDFLPRVAREAEGKWEFRVFDLQGVEVFRSVSALHPWNGTSKQGDSLGRGRYTWVLTLDDRDGNPMLYTDEVRVE